MALRLGAHPSNLHLTLARRHPELFTGLGVVWVDYPDGRSTGRLIADGAIDLGGTGSTPPILAQAEGLEVRYLAASPPRRGNGALLVMMGGSIATVADLRGRRIALIDGSFHTYLLARLLEGEGMSLRDVVRVDMAPDASGAALAGGAVDAWVAMEPHLTATLSAGSARALAADAGAIPNRSLFWTDAARAASCRTVIQEVLVRLAEVGRRIVDHPDDAAAFLVARGVGGAGAGSWSAALARRDWRLLPADAVIVAEQQAEADTLARHGDLAGRIRITAPTSERTSENRA